MRRILRITAASSALALGVTGANAAMLLTEDPLTGQKVVVDTDDPNYREEVMIGSEGTERPANCPEGAYFLFEDPQSGQRIVADCVGDRRFIVSQDDGTERPPEIPEGAFFLTEDPLTGQKETYSTPMEAPRNQR